METKENELSKLSNLVMDFDEVNVFRSYIDRMKNFRAEDESEEFSVIKSAFICLMKENEKLKKDNEIIKTPLFKTNDGVEIFNGDKYFRLFTKSKSKHRMVEKYIAFNGMPIKKIEKCFSTKEAAFKWYFDKRM